jgi:NAD(P)-dependent dehydrogenase (short-subunit alcohol dehydrogenase family)
MSLHLSGKAIVITGAFGVLGAATARAVAKEGGRVALIDCATTAPSDLMTDCGSNAIELGGVDLTSAQQASNAIDKAYVGLQGLDILINIAGMFRWQPVVGGDSETWDLLYATNVKTALNSTRAALKHMPKNGESRIINLGANSAVKSGSGMGAYAASKAAVHRLTESLAEELKDLGITVNAILPSIIDTPANRAEMPQADFSKWVAPQAIAKVIVFIASPEAQAITGALLPVTGRV